MATKNLTNNNQKGWSNRTKKMNIIIGTENNPTKFTSGEVIINKKSTKKNLDKLIDINNDVKTKKTTKKITTDATEGGLLKGKPHYDKNGKPLGGIPGKVDGTKPIETEGDEFVVNAEASKKHWQELSKINQENGNGVPIGPPTETYDEDPSEEFERGGKIQFNPNYLPNKWIMSFAKKIKANHPEIWKLGGNIFGNEAFENLKRVSERGYWLDSEEWMYIKWRSYVARHKKDFRIEGVVAMLKWVDKVDKGWPYMKNLIQEKINQSNKMEQGGMLPMQGILITPDKTKKINFKRTDNGYEYFISDNVSSTHNNKTLRIGFKKRKGNPLNLSQNEFIEFLYQENFLDPNMRKDKNGNDCIEFIKKTESILNNGYYLDLKETNNVRDAYSQFPLNLKGVIITYNSGNQKDLKCIDTVNIDFLNDILEKKFKLTEAQSRLVSHYYLHNARRFDTMQIIDEIVDKDIYIIDRNFLDCSPKASKMNDGGNVDFGKVSSASSRFKPSETIVFDPPLVGLNGNKLISYTWKYEWTTDFSIKTGDAIEKRVSDWTQAELSADTGRNIVHSFTILKPDGSYQSVSSESVPVIMGFVSKEQKKDFSNLATASKTLAKQQMQLSILEAKQKEFEELKRSIIDAGYPEIKIEPWYSDDQVKLIMGDGSVVADANNPYEKERIEVLQDSYVRGEMLKLGINSYRSNNSYQISELKKRIERQKRKVENITNSDKMAEGGNIDLNVEEILGRIVDVHYMGVSEPDYFKIKEVKITPENFRHRDVTLRGDIGVSKFPLEQLQDFLDGKQIIIRDDNEEYAITLTKERLKKGGKTISYDTYKDKYNRKYNYPKNTSHSLEEISKDTGVSMKGLQQIYNKGIGAFKTNPESVRPNVQSKEQWAMARIYSAVMGGAASQIDSHELQMNKGGNVDKQDTVTMDIPLMIRTLELAREDIHSDAELHFVVENLLHLKNKKVLTMDDYAYIADVEHKHFKKYAHGGNVGTNQKEVSIGFGGLGNGTTVWDRNRIQNGDYKIIAHISDSGKITYYDKNLPEYAKTKIEQFAEEEKQRLAEGGELSQGYDFSPIQTPLN